MSEHHYGLRMRQSVTQFERSFLLQAEQEQRRREQLERTVAARSRARFRERANRRSSLRFYLLTVSLVVTAIAVTVIMLGVLYALLV